jgi:hypothetical protein
MRLASGRLGTGFGYQKNWRSDLTHRLYWDLSTSLDHVGPVSLGGSWWEVSNLATACWRCQEQKSNLPLSDLGWTLKRPEGSWDGLSGAYRDLWWVCGQPNPREHEPWINAFERAWGATQVEQPGRAPTLAPKRLSAPSPSPKPLARLRHRPAPPQALTQCVSELTTRMDALAARLGLQVKQGGTGRNYRPAGRERGATYTSGIGVWSSSRGVEFNLQVFRERGDHATADDLLLRLERATGAPRMPPNWPALPCALILANWDRVRAEVIEPYFRARGAHQPIGTAQDA